MAVDVSSIDRKITSMDGRMDLEIVDSSSNNLECQWIPSLDGVINNLTTIIATNDKTPIKINIPGTPISLFIIGPKTRDIAKVNPIETPTIPMAFVRLSLEVKSANNALKTAEIAPAP